MQFGEPPRRGLLRCRLLTDAVARAGEGALALDRRVDRTALHAGVEPALHNPTQGLGAGDAMPTPGVCTHRTPPSKGLTQSLPHTVAGQLTFKYRVRGLTGASPVA